MGMCLKMNSDYFENISSIKILGTRVDAIGIPAIIQFMESWITKNHYHNYIVVANVDTIITSKRNILMQEAVNKSSLAIPDGFPLLCLERLYGYPLKKRAYGPGLMHEFLKITEDKDYSHFFYGATEDTLAKLIKNIKTLYPKTKIAGFYAPPFKPLTEKEDKRVIEMINNIAPDVLWVGLGCPKQELWMYDHSKKLNTPVMVGVGAAFDFLAGVKPQAPRWVGDNGFEWLFRLITEPKRLWCRYLVNYPLFVHYVLIDLISKSYSRLKAGSPKS